MKNKKCLFLVITLLFVGAFVINPVEAKRGGSGNETQLQSDTAGVQGNEGETLKAVKENKDIEAYCLSDKADECKIKFKEIVDIYKDISKEKNNFCKSLKKGDFKGTGHDNEANKLVGQRNNRDDLLKKKEIKEKDAELVKKYPIACSLFVDSLKQQSIIEKQERMEKMADSLAKEAQDYKNGNQDQPDVEPVESGYLESGDLVAWGIPGIPYIPTPSPKAKTSSSSSTSTPAQKQEISDEGYKSLRSIEMESEKVTEPEKDQFISELNSRVGSN